MSHYELRRYKKPNGETETRLEVKAYSELLAPELRGEVVSDAETRDEVNPLDGGQPEDELLCVGCGHVFTRAEVLDATGDVKQCPDCNGELVTHEDDDDDESEL